jgi:predicted TIM-barrel fold metal-dependent hydrolase
MIIDVHYHLGKGDSLSAFFQCDAKVETLLKHQKEAGVDRTIVFPVRYKRYREANEEIASLCAQHPSLIGFARVNASEESAGEEAEYAIRELGLKGIKIHNMDGFPIRQTMDKIASLQVPVLVHTGIGLSPMKYEPLIQCYPEMTIVLAHVGCDTKGETMFEYPEHAIRLAAQYERVYVDTSAVFLLYALERAVRVCGPSKMIFGSDGPWFHPAVSRRQLELLGLNEQELDDVLGGNISRILGLQ